MNRRSRGPGCADKYPTAPRFIAAMQQAADYDFEAMAVKGDPRATAAVAPRTAASRTSPAMFSGHSHANRTGATTTALTARWAQACVTRWASWPATGTARWPTAIATSLKRRRTSPPHSTVPPTWGRPARKQIARERWSRRSDPKLNAPDGCNAGFNAQGDARGSDSLRLPGP